MGVRGARRQDDRRDGLGAGPLGAVALGDAPGLGDAARRRVRRSAVEDLADRSDAAVVEMLEDAAQERRRRLPAERGFPPDSGPDEIPLRLVYNKSK